MLNKSSLDKLFLPRFMLFTYLEVQKSVYFCVKGQNSKQNRKGWRLVGICQRQLPGEDQGGSPGPRSLNFLIQLQMQSVPSLFTQWTHCTFVSFSKTSIILMVWLLFLFFNQAEGIQTYKDEHQLLFLSLRLVSRLLIMNNYNYNNE